jgi:hypothetical protein
MGYSAIRCALASVAALVMAALLAGGSVAAGQLACDVTTNNTFSGRVTQLTPVMTVRGTDNKDRAVSAASGLTVIRDGATAAYGDLRVGDVVNVTVAPGAADCAATRIEASSAAPVGTAAEADEDEDFPWGLLGLLGLGGLAGLLRRPKQEERVIERTVMEPREPVVTTPVTPIAPTERTVLRPGERVVLEPRDDTRRER